MFDKPLFIYFQNNLKLKYCTVTAMTLSIRKYL